MRRDMRTARGYLLTGDKPWERYEATVIVAKTATAMADGEAALLEECVRAGRSVEFIASSDVGEVRIYRVWEPS